MSKPKPIEVPEMTIHGISVEPTLPDDYVFAGMTFDDGKPVTAGDFAKMGEEAGGAAMKIALVVLAGMTGCAAWGQQPTVPTSVTATILHCPFNEVIEKTATGEACVVPKPLKCGKYQHVEPTCESDGNVTICNGSPKCADDMHSVTEKEWQELVGRLKELEERLKCYGKPCFSGQ
jgi:hypothetical protein